MEDPGSPTRRPPLAELEKITEAGGYGRLPVCIAKTATSLSDDAKLAGSCRGDFVATVHDLELSAVGADM